ncbi:hypothetical protein DFH09DRAFT_910859, partial [Mycena vulgaris]
MTRRYEGHTTRLLFDDYVSDAFEITDGLDQGDPHSVLSYLFYNAPLARIDDNSGIYIDDYHLLSIGDTLQETNQAITEIVTKEGGVDDWGRTHNSVFGVAKDQVCCFSKRRKHPNLIINGVTVKPSKAVKLVGVWLDEGLTFREQAAATIGKGHEWLVAFRRLAHVSKGVGLAYVCRLYLAICVPRMFYGAEVFLAPIHQRQRGGNQRHNGRVIVKKMRTIQLRAARMIVSGMASSLGDMLDAHADLTPMHLVIDKHLQKAALRYATLPKTHPLYEAVRNAGKQHVKRHPHPLHFLMNAYRDVKQHLVETIPATRRMAGWKAPVDVHVASSKEEAKEWAMAEPSRVQLFSDGLLIDGMVGAAGLMMVDGVVTRSKGVQLGKASRYGVYEAEGVGEMLAMECL